MTDVPSIRARNRADLLRADAVRNLIDRLEYFEATPTPLDSGGRARRLRIHAEMILDAVLALTKPRTDQS